MAEEEKEPKDDLPQDPPDDKEPEDVPEVPQVDVYELLASIPGSPNKDQIDFWKTQNDVNLSVFSDKEVYVWRPINWMEYKSLQASETPDTIDPQAFNDEQLVYKCVLWPKVTPDKMPTLKAGTVPTLSQQIMEGSNFVPPAYAMNFVYKL